MILKEGMQSPDVLNLERVLLGLGYQGLVADGYFDQKTKNVVINVQKSNNLQPDGIAGPKTFEVLDRLFEADKPNFTSSHIIPVQSAPILVNKDLPDIYHGLHPNLTDKLLKMKEIAEQEGYQIKLTQGLRTFKEQDNLYLQGRRGIKGERKVTNAKGGFSFHNYGIAGDWAFIVGDKISWDEKLYQNLGRWASRVGLEWGGNWHFRDLPHCQLPGMTSIRALLAEYQANGGGENGIRSVWRKFVK